jgi:hypothetical protein
MVRLQKATSNVLYLSDSMQKLEPFQYLAVHTGLLAITNYLYMPILISQHASSSSVKTEAAWI